MFPLTTTLCPRSRFTSGRSVITPEGNTGYQFVREGNVLLGRVVLLVLVASSMGIRWLVEQPSNSILAELPRWRWLLNRVRVICLGYGWAFGFSC